MGKHRTNDTFTSEHRMTVKGVRRTFELEHLEDGLLVYTSGVEPFKVQSETEARNTLRTVFEQWESLVKA